MESSAIGKCIPHNSRKRVFPESSSGTESKGEPSSAPGNRTLKDKNKMRNQNEDNNGIIISPTLKSHTGMESSNPWFLDSVNTQSTCPDHTMPSTTRIAGLSSSTYPSLRLQKSAMKVKSVKKLIKTRPHKMSSNSRHITPMEDSRKIHKSSNVAGTSSNIKQHENNEVFRKYSNVKKFYTVKDHSDHHYKGANSEMMQASLDFVCLARCG
ncbi:hypothetical protein L2E82_10446 [Cichorium intybus]|uniref:Uncharacterized protein n=1 Tax=Cichorium intybus TaxID=13427 RepID=A0ACB9GAM6_CICIN|nr:hypothetical protein L2E82_10446 [Cichorium intybus]